ncbi:enoyl-CoA hydratase [Sphingobacterium psychroaquaticum]|uniref:enoyl-CoA hydratase-related protein n=1 Tax=Sphingobacterium psychroaquaticum TaxID=561061 RepID=UPI00106AD217|nr:enoyl-CoA hydratase-related protein [Sphingobacterium psychroaquaticum]QBQ39806.1 enoyl-CoA hydratase [Sphingobacterium psychroaquaticum]
MGQYENLLLTLSGQTAIITINRPTKLNALNRATLGELADLLGALKTNREVSGIILTGAGEKAFVAGADIAEFVGHSEEEGRAMAAWGQEHVMNVIHNFPKPVIGAINGFALGGGLEIALSCHIRVAVETAKMGLPEVSLGVIPGYGGTQRLPALVGRGKAMEMILTGDMIGAKEALTWGLVNYVVPATDLLHTCESLLNKIYTRSGTAVAAAIEAINASQTGVKGFDVEIDAFGKAFGTADFKEGVSAFLDKRTPNFTGNL